MKRFLAVLVPLLAGACAPGSAAVRGTPAPAAVVAPDSFVIRFTTTKGPFDLKVHRAWAPRGAARLYELTKAHFYDSTRFYRTVDKFMTQFGMNGDTAVGRAWRDKRILDDTVKISNKRGTLSFASGGRNTRTTQLFINYGDNSRLDTLASGGFAVVGEVMTGMNTVVDSLYKGYGELPPRGQAPEQGRIAREGNAYLVKDFPKLDFIVTARIVAEWKR